MTDIHADRLVQPQSSAVVDALRAAGAVRGSLKDFLPPRRLDERVLQEGLERFGAACFPGIGERGQ